MMSDCLSQTMENRTQGNVFFKTTNKKGLPKIL